MALAFFLLLIVKNDFSISDLICNNKDFKILIFYRTFPFGLLPLKPPLLPLCWEHHEMKPFLIETSRITRHPMGGWEVIRKLATPSLRFNRDRAHLRGRKHFGIGLRNLSDDDGVSLLRRYFLHTLWTLCDTQRFNNSLNHVIVINKGLTYLLFHMMSVYRAASAMEASKYFFFLQTSTQNWIQSSPNLHHSPLSIMINTRRKFTFSLFLFLTNFSRNRFIFLVFFFHFFLKFLNASSH